MSRPPRILFYCQYLLGLGHLTRSLALSEALGEDFTVDLILGGPPIERRVHSKRVTIHPIEPLLMREHDSSLYSPQGTGVPEVFALRERQLSAVLAREKYDVLVTELFPFGRGKFKNEVLALIAGFRAANPRGLVACSVRDILVEQEGDGGKERKMAELAQKHYDWILVHSDPALIRLERTFPATEIVREKIEYTGFVCEPRPAQTGRVARRPEVLVSLGGGSVGTELIEAILRAAPLLADLRFRFKISPFLDARARQLLGETRLENVASEPFSTDFESELSEVALSISMGGYNTVMNVLNTATPALILAYDANHEQALRGKILEREGYLNLVSGEILGSAESMASLIRRRLEAPYPSRRPNLEGGPNSARFLRSRLAQILAGERSANVGL